MLMSMSGGAAPPGRPSNRRVPNLRSLRQDEKGRVTVKSNTDQLTAGREVQRGEGRTGEYTGFHVHMHVCT